MTKESVFRRWLVIVIIVLFVGTSIVPSISGNIKNNTSQINKLNSLLLNPNDQIAQKQE